MARPDPDVFTARDISDWEEHQGEEFVNAKDYDALVERLERAEKLIDRAAVLLHNSDSPRYAEWHDDFDAWLVDARAGGVST